MKRETEDPMLDERDVERHPAFGMISASRVTTMSFSASSDSGAVLFDSDIKHGQFITVSITRASRKRNLKSDWIHSGDELIEVAMSEAQWASFVSSMNTSGVPCTIRRTESETFVPGLEFAPRLQESMREVHDAATEAFGEILGALKELEDLEQGDSTPKQRREALRNLKIRIQNATPNVDFAGKRLSEHAENVVQKARADIEAFVLSKAKQLKLEAGDIQGLYELDAPQRDGAKELES